MIISFRISQENFSWFSSKEKINRKTAEEQVKVKEKLSTQFFVKVKFLEAIFYQSGNLFSVKVKCLKALFSKAIFSQVKFSKAIFDPNEKQLLGMIDQIDQGKHLGGL